MAYQTPLPGIIRFGSGVSGLLPEILPAGNVLIVCGSHSAESIEKNIIPRLGPVKAEICCVPPELPLDAIKNIISTAERIQPASVVGWGGGSAMDGAKAAAALIGLPLPVEEYFYNRAEIPLRKLFLALVPTTAGTGAEITANAVLLDPATGIKQSLRAPGMTADAALIDPELLKGAPFKVIASAGFDALTQALESFTSNRADDFTRQIALTAASLLLRALDAACGQESSAFEDLARGSMLTGMAFAASGLGAVHGLAHPIGSRLHIGHGECCAILLVDIMKWNCRSCRPIYTELARGLGFADADGLIGHIAALRSKAGLPENFRDAGLQPEMFDFIVKNCRSGSMKCNPVFISDAEIIAVLEGLR